MLLRILIIITLISSLCNVHAQYYGNYTIGGTDPDFESFEEALTLINYYGTWDTVYLNIRPGVYEGFYFTHFNPEHVVVFKSETGDSSDVLITDSASTTIYCSHSNNMAFRDLVIENRNPTKRSLEISGVEYVELTRCRFGRVDVSIVNYVTNCEFLGYAEIYGEADSEVNNCNFHSIAHVATGFISNNLFFMTADVRAEIITNNEFYNGAYFGSHISISHVSNNYINLGASLYGHRIIFSDNLILGGVSNSTSIYTKLINNIILGDVSPGIFDLVYIIGNRIYGNIFPETDNILCNNYFYGHIEPMGESNVKIFNNNFAPGSWLYMNNCYNCEVLNNNFSREPGGYPGSSIMYNNNYYPSGGFYDSKPYNIDPQYIDSINVVTQNSQLIGRGAPYLLADYDIDSIARAYYPTIGANELCLSADSLLVNCGDSVLLSLCSRPETGNFYWQPSTGLSDSMDATPQVSLHGDSIWYFVQDTSANYFDSIFVYSTPFQVEANDDLTINCVHYAPLFANYNSSATYTWSPTNGLITTEGPNVFAHYEQTTTYTVSAVVAGCETSQDQVIVTYNELPDAIAYVSIDSLTVQFYNYSECADNFQWIFGDITAGYDPNPAHVYEDEGLYTVRLVAYNGFGTDTLFIDLNLVYTGIESKSEISSLCIYPNPATLYVNMDFYLQATRQCSILLYNLSGELVLSESFPAKPGHNHLPLNLNDIRPGMYILTLSTGKEVIRKKIVIL